MLSPEARAVAVDFLRPPSGWKLDQCLLTTYSLDLEALLALPLAVMSHDDGGLDEVLSDPLLLLEALREAGDRIHVFVDRAGIAIPRTQRSIYSLLESSVHPVAAPNEGVFHPKLWLARFVQPDSEPRLRVAILSRNLTFDRSWDIALVSEATPSGVRRKRESRDLGTLLRALPSNALRSPAESVLTIIEELAYDVERCRFPAPERFKDSVEFHTLGLTTRRRPWVPRETGFKLMAISPFLSPGALSELAGIVDGERILVSRQDALDRISQNHLQEWDKVFVLSEDADSEPDDDVAGCPDGLHAKLIAIEHGRRATWYVGSTNLTDSAYLGRNVELMASVSAGRFRNGITSFFDSGFLKLCEEYRPASRDEKSNDAVEAARKLEAARRALLEKDALRIKCAPEGNEWRWELIGDIDIPTGIEVHAWPVSQNEDSARALDLPLSLSLPPDRLTAFVAFRLSASGLPVDDIRMTLLLPASGMPDDRMSHVLRSLIDSPERFLRFLRALLGGPDGLADWAAGDDAKNGGSFQWGNGFNDESLLEDLVRAAATDPEKLEPVRRLINDLLVGDQERAVLTEKFLSIWNAVDEAVSEVLTR